MSAAAELTAAAIAVLETADPAEKAALTRRSAEAWRAGSLACVGTERPPDRPARPERPALCPPHKVPRRRIGTAPQGRIALLHALAHIELNAIDLAWDIVARFAAELPEDQAPAFCGDWVRVADEEATHFTLLSRRLAELGAGYGDLPAHDGLWQAALETRHDLLARLAVVPLVLEARGLDVTPAMIEKLAAVGDEESAAALRVIYRDEIGHVEIGKRWFDRLCAERRLDPPETWRSLVASHFRGRLKPPFNAEAREVAGFPVEAYAARAVDSAT